MKRDRVERQSESKSEGETGIERGKTKAHRGGEKNGNWEKRRREVGTKRGRDRDENRIGEKEKVAGTERRRKRQREEKRGRRKEMGVKRTWKKPKAEGRLFPGKRGARTTERGSSPG